MLGYQQACAFLDEYDRSARVRSMLTVIRNDARDRVDRRID